jgi:hypothetical protein
LQLLKLKSAREERTAEMDDEILSVDGGWVVECSMVAKNNIRTISIQLRKMQNSILARDVLPVHTVMHRTISQYYINEAVKRGIDRKQAQAGSVIFLQSFGGSINANLHCHFVFLERVYVDRSEQGLKARFVKLEPATDNNIAEVVSKIRQRVISSPRHGCAKVPWRGPLADQSNL